MIRVVTGGAGGRPDVTSFGSRIEIATCGEGGRRERLLRRGPPRECQPENEGNPRHTGRREKPQESPQFRQTYVHEMASAHRRRATESVLNLYPVIARPSARRF